MGNQERKRQGFELATLFDNDELYAIGHLVKPTPSDWGNAHLCTFHRCPYIRDRDARRCHSGNRFRNGGALTLHGVSAKRFQLHIEEALMSTTTAAR